MMKHLKYVTILIAILFSCSALSDSYIEYTKGTNSDVVEGFISILNSKESEKVANSISYPESFTAEELEEDQQGLASAHEMFFQYFGEFGQIKAVDEGASFYEVGVYGGTIHWWASEKSTKTKRYLYAVNFANHGDGYIKVFTSNKNNMETVVSFFYALPLNSVSKKKIISVTHSLLDLFGIPKNHPYRQEMENSLPVSR